MVTYLFIEIHSEHKIWGTLAAATSPPSLSKTSTEHYVRTLQGAFNQPERSPQLAFKAHLCITKEWDV